MATPAIDLTDSDYDSPLDSDEEGPCECSKCFRRLARENKQMLKDLKKKQARIKTLEVELAEAIKL